MKDKYERARLTLRMKLRDEGYTNIEIDSIILECCPEIENQCTEKCILTEKEKIRLARELDDMSRRK